MAAIKIADYRFLNRLNKSFTLVLIYPKNVRIIYNYRISMAGKWCLKLSSHNFRLSWKYSFIRLYVLPVSISVIFTDFCSSKVQNLDLIDGFGQPTLILSNLRLVHVNLKTSPKISVIFRLSIFYQSILSVCMNIQV